MLRIFQGLSISHDLLLRLFSGDYCGNMEIVMLAISDLSDYSLTKSVGNILILLLILSIGMLPVANTFGQAVLWKFKDYIFW